VRILGAHVQKDVCSPREISHVPRKVAEDRATGPYFMGEVSRGHSSPVNELGEEKNREVADWMKARTVPPAEWWG
jgi:hypothetical protein